MRHPWLNSPQENLVSDAAWVMDAATRAGRMLAELQVRRETVTVGGASWTVAFCSSVGCFFNLAVG